MDTIIFISIFFIVMFIPFLFILILIDRIMLSNKGFSSYGSFLMLSLLICTSLPMFLFKLNNILPRFFERSFITYILGLHVMSLFIINLLIVSLIYFILYIDFLFKTKLKIISVCIISSDYLSFKSILRNTKFLKICLVISYFFSTLVILFSIPDMMINILKYDTEILNKVTNDIKLYQQLFVFLFIPILFSIINLKGN